MVKTLTAKAKSFRLFPILPSLFLQITYVVQPVAKGLLLRVIGPAGSAGA